MADPCRRTYAVEARLQQEAEDTDLAVLNMIYWMSSSPTASIPLIQLAQRAGVLSGDYTEEMVKCGAASLIYFINQMRIERGNPDSLSYPAWEDSTPGSFHVRLCYLCSKLRQRREIANRCGPMPSSTSSSPAPLTPEEQAGVDEILALMESGALVLPATVYRWKFEDNNGHPMRPKSLYNTLRLYLWHNNGRGAIYPS